MTLVEYYLQYFTELCEGRREPPEGISLPEATPEARAAALQPQILALGLPAFVRACAQQDGLTLPQALYDEFDPDGLLAAAQALARTAQLAPQDPAPASEPDAPPIEEPDGPHIEEPDGPRNACEVLLDCCLLDDKLFAYLADVLVRQDGLGFFRLAQVTTRTALRPEDFLLWLATRERFAEPEEQACVAILDACLARVQAEGQTELLAALLSGDRKTFELFRCDAPELRQLPDATYEWYSRNYLDKYYSVRFMLRTLGVRLPEGGGAA